MRGEYKIAFIEKLEKYLKNIKLSSLKKQENA